jgi:DNA repair exonuclease SbcCD nuclease subunit
MSKALVFSDLHLHAHKGSVDRLNDCLAVLDWVFRTAADKGAKHIFFLGDLFHERGKIDVLNYLRTFEVFMKHMLTDAKDLDVYLLVGNHDMYHKQRWDVNSVKPLTAIPRVHLIDKPTTMKIDGRTIDWLPHTENPMKELKALKSVNDESSLFLGHLALAGATLNVYYGTKSDVIVEYDNDMAVVDGEIFMDWDLAILGHYHGFQQLCGGKVIYVGSPLQLGFGEAYQTKHIMLLDLETLKREYVVNDFSPRHYIVTPDEIDNEVYDINGHFVRAIVENTGAKEIVDLKQKIKTQFKVASFDFKQKDKKADEGEETLVEDAKQILYQEGEMLQVWVDECQRSGKIPEKLDLAHLLECGKRCLEKSAS